VSFRAFGLRVAARFALPELTEQDAEDNDEVDLELTLADPDDVRRAFSGPASPPAVHVGMLGDGDSYRTERGRDHDHLIEFAPRAVFYLDAPASQARCAPIEESDPSWRRFLLDTVLGTAALARGGEALHAAAVLTTSGVVAIAALTGGGKSTLAAEMIRRGGALFTDDLLFLSVDGGTVVGHPGPPLMNLHPAMPAGLRPGDLGRIAATIDGECWTEVDRTPPAPAAVTAVVLLDRTAPVLEIEVLSPNPLPLLANALPAGHEGGRAARRFELFADLASQATLISLRAPADASPGSLADLVGSART
jgi:HPr kinase/phosphorylase